MLPSELHHHSEQIGLLEQEEVMWQSFLRDFETEVWPIFRKKGYSKDTALLFFMQHQTMLRISDLQDELRAE